MRKNILCILFVLLIMITVTGCGKQKEEKNYGIITDASGNKTEVTAQEMIDTYNSNATKFNSLYSKKDIEVTDTVEKVSEAGNVTCLYLKNGWVIAYHESRGSFISFVSDLNSGDKVHVSGAVYNVGGYCDWNKSKVEIDITSDSIMELAK